MTIETLYRNEYGLILAGIVRRVGDVQLAEDVVQEAFAAAVEQWQGVLPERPAAWIFSTARHKAIDRLRRRSLEATSLAALRLLESESEDEPEPQDALRLLFTCCHPALAEEAQIALTLRTLGGLSTEEIARAFLVPPATMAQRIVRAKAKIRDANIPYAVPEHDALAERLEGVMATLYLVFNEGYAATFGDTLVRGELCTEAIRLTRLLVRLLPEASEPQGLLALMLLHDSRRETRQDETGSLVRLEDQDRTRWNHAQIREGAALVESALGLDAPGPYALEAAIAALHAQASSAAQTDWRQIAALYTLLWRVRPTPIVELNRAVAVAMANGPRAGLALIDELEGRGELSGYALAKAARADLLARLGEHEPAKLAYLEAISLTTNQAERAFLERRVSELKKS